MADTKKEYTSNLHPKGDLDTTVYPNVKSENIIDKDTTAYTAGKVPDSSMVSKSLDSLNEKIETNKIQTDTNKTNIATLQGDVSSLKQDNQTTKTTIAGLVSSDTTNKENIAKNTQNIDNLSAVMPTDINVDSEYNYILEHDGEVITGQKKNVKAHWDFDNSYSTIFEYQIDSIIVSRIDNKIQKGNIVMGQGSYDSGLQRSDTFIKVVPILYNEPAKNSQYGKLNYNIASNLFEITNYSGQGSYVTTLRIPLPSETKKVTITVPAQKNGTLALVEDLAKKQDKRFIHTVEIHYASNGSYFCFTGTSDKNTPIDSVQALTTVFANRDLCGVGVFGSAGLSKIHVGSSVNDTTFKKYMNNGEYANPSEETFAMVFNTTGFTITDSVKPL